MTEIDKERQINTAEWYLDPNEVESKVSEMSALVDETVAKYPNLPGLKYVYACFALVELMHVPVTHYSSLVTHYCGLADDKLIRKAELLNKTQLRAV